MADEPMMAGPALRRLRKRENLTQAAMASRLAISASYLNLIERNQRPVTARVLVQLISEFAFDPQSLKIDERIGGLDGLVRRVGDERFADLGIDREEVDTFLSESPQIAAAFARLYDQAGHPAALPNAEPTYAVRTAIEHWKNHFSDLDHAAEALADEMRLSRGNLSAALVDRLRERHQLAVRILPREVMPDHRRRLDLHARQVQLAEMLGPRSRTFQMAVQLAELEQRDEIEKIVQGAKLEDDSSREFLKRHLSAYFAAALIMPYGRFLRACDATGYDLSILLRRFEVSFEQLAHRLTTLQRVGQRGLPFFMLRVDGAGQLSKRFVGASGATFFDTEQLCPLWIAMKTFRQPGDLLTELVSLEETAGEAKEWFCMARTVSVGGAAGESSRFSVVLGLDARLGGALVQSHGKSLDEGTPTRIGPGCRQCHRVDCQQRSLPPASGRLVFDPLGRASLPYAIARDIATS
ncbi:short-chain fatty acyl-CoA regulator family protein [Qipengyuania sp.]|uniref:helix-turn-helix domain-containing protein n=1 Tax=Qipengyuania sp. TaxID=2004515 RepID=UPI0035C7B954